MYLLQASLGLPATRHHDSTFISPSAAVVAIETAAIWCARRKFFRARRISNYAGDLNKAAVVEQHNSGKTESGHERRGAARSYNHMSKARTYSLQGEIQNEVKDTLYLSVFLLPLPSPLGLNVLSGTL